ncbi:MAG: hypothetical protein IPG42_12930 [Betaproteobacteria bacterium]|nr:hypothetical protein [Betaproteobacteria bacterium]
MLIWLHRDNFLQIFMNMFSSSVKSTFALIFSLILASCGGGGGSAGSTGSTSSTSGTSTFSGSTTTTSTTASVTLTLVDQTGNVISGRTLSQTQQQFLKVVVKDTKGAVAPLSTVKVTADDKLLTVTPSGGLLTDNLGVALFRVAPASVTSSGVVTVDVASTVNAVAVTQTIDLQINPGTIELGTLTLNPTVLQRGQSLNVSASVLLNGFAATSNSVSVVFSSTCGAVSPTSALADSVGKASAVVQTTIQGDCSVTATAGGNSVSSTYRVTAPPIAGLQFVKASPTTIYQIGSTGANTSIVQFMVIDTVGGPVSGIPVTAALSNLDGGINFCNSPSTATSGADGIVAFSVCAGTLPTNVQVKASLVDTPSVTTSSNILTIQTGLPTQRFFSLSASQFNFYVGAGFTDKIDGNKVDITLRAADRQGNPVPNGTPITFVTEGGQINTTDGKNLSSCLINDGGCTVKLIGQNYRPWGSSATGGEVRPGRVTVLAYADGEESFIDGNNNNRYDVGELFEDLGTPYLDKDESRAFASTYTNLVVGTNDGEVTYPIPASASGTSSCPANSNVGLSVENTCNAKWDGLTKVRGSLTIVFSGGEVCPPSGYDTSIPSSKRTQIISASRDAVRVQLADCNGNPLPADAVIAVVVSQAPATPDGQCAATFSGTNIGSTTEPTQHGIILTKCNGGETVSFNVTVTLGSGTKITGFGVVLP